MDISTQKMNPLVVVFVLCALGATVHGAADNIDWCYHEQNCSESHWPTIAPEHCNGSRQSPINIVSANATEDSALTAFSFVNYGNTSALLQIENTGKTVKVNLMSGVQVSGGGLSEAYDSLQFHLHWGNGSEVKGSEHKVNGQRYAMEMHIVNFKSSHSGNTTLAVADSTGLAALGFFIEEMSGNATNSPASWSTLTSHLINITLKGQHATLPAGLSLDDLLGNVDRTKYYRYLGSLTTPACNEAVVWTVFKESIKISKDLIDLFSSQLHVRNVSSSPLITNVFRNVQPAQPVTTTTTTAAPTTTAPTTSSTSRASFSLGLMALSLLLKTVSN